MRRFLVLLLVFMPMMMGVGVASSRAQDSSLPALEKGNRDDQDDKHDDDKDCDDDSSGSGGDYACEDDDHSGRDHPEVDGMSMATIEATTEATAESANDNQVVVDPEIRIAGRTFAPSTITIEVGTTVTFINDDDREHTATGETFDTGVIAPGASATITFDQVGTFDFICNIHTEMRGRIVVIDPSTSGTPTVTPTSEATPDATASASVPVNIADIAFGPESITIPPGTTVTWTNNDIVDHTVTGDWADSGLIAIGESYAFTFDEAGTFDYVCTIHPGMTGTIIVDANAPPIAG